MFKSTLFAMGVFISCWAMAGQYNDVPHYDHRETPHLQFYPDYQLKAGLRGENRAYDFLSSHAATYKLDVDQLVLVRTQASLIAMHYHYQQMLNGYPVQGAEIVVSIAHNTGEIYRVYNNTFPVAQQPLMPAALVDVDDAYDVAWNDLGVHGELLAQPGAAMVYVPEGKNFHLAWQVDLHVAAPAGEWRTMVNAANGRILSQEDRRITRKPTHGKYKTKGPIANRADAFAAFEAKQQMVSVSKNTSLADGTGVVFDPDPRTTLNDETIVDTSPASAFTDAYFTRDLLDIQVSGGVYSPIGPWITVLDWDPPTNPPSTTTDGNWTALRGDNAFNDATTYFHIDQNQRYMQGLGFTGATGIQEGSIGTDTDGAGGADNSYYSPGSNRMSFGHGCVDDNEDADVILHEYGHAIHFSINSNWGGGDAGAIGEGFGDYWAGSYSYSTPNGPVFHPEWVFTWDGHSSCWGGRLLDKTTLQYDPSRTYGAHQGIPGGISDELWSAPIFAAFLDLIGEGRPRDEMDQIILESHFGMGSGVTMRTLGNATIAAAAALQPDGPHAGIYQTRFLAQNIIDLPHVSLEASELTVNSEPGGNSEADPGETVDLQLRVLNGGNLLASSITATLSSTNPAVTVDAGTSSYPDLGIGLSAVNLTPFTITLDPDLACGESVNLDLLVEWVDTSLAPGSITLSYTLTTGVALGISESSSPSLPIVDNSTVQDVLTSASTGTVTANFNVDVDITHSYIGDLTITLRAPDGTEVILHNATGGGDDDIVGNYPGTLTPAEPLSAFEGKDTAGDWTLLITDSATQDQGVLNSWGINDVTGYECDGALPFCMGDLNGDRVVDVADYNIAVEGWTTEVADANQDGMSNILDHLQLRAAYGPCDE